MQKKVIAKKKFYKVVTKQNLERRNSTKNEI